MAEALIKVLDTGAAADAAVNLSSGQWWAKCPQGKVQRIRGIGICCIGTAGSAAGAQLSSGYKLEAKIDQRPIATFNMPTMIAEETGANAEDTANQIFHLIDSVVPINDVMTPGEELNLIHTQAANHAAIIILIMQLVDLAEVR